MTRRIVCSLLAMVALVGAITPAGAHGPEEDKKPEIPPGVTVTPGPALTKESAATGVDVRGTIRSLRSLTLDATRVVVADVVRTEVYDENRLHVYRLRGVRTLKGDDGSADIGVPEVRGDSKRPPLLADGEHVVVFLREAQRLTYLTHHVGTEPMWELLGRRDAVVPIGDDSQVDVVSRLMAHAASDGKDPAVAKARRASAFECLGTRNGRLVLDAIGELSALADWPPLADDEVSAIGGVLRERAVPATTRVQLLQLLGERKAKQALSVVMSAPADEPEILDAVLAVRIALGAPASREEIGAYLKSDDAGVRSAALRALAALGDSGAVGEIGRVALGDRDPAVRAAAVDALGTTKSPAAVPIVTQVFDGDDVALRQHAARAFVALGSDAADQSLIDLALKGKSPETKKYAALVLTVMRGKNHPSVQRLIAANPPGEVMEVLEHGLQMGHSHQPGQEH